MRSNGLVWRLTLALLVLASCGMRDDSLARASASATPSATATPTQAATATAASTEQSRYGYVMASQGRIVVRPERSTTAVLAIGGDAPVASHDGRRVAFWRTGPQGNNPQELRLVEIPSGTERVLTTIPAGQGGGAIAWANDDSGLLYESHSTAAPPPGSPQSGPANSTLFAYDLLATQAPGATTSELMLSGGLVLIPLAWDKAGKIASALTTGEGGYAVHYYVWDMKVQPPGVSAVKRTQFPWSTIYGTVRASHDAKRLLAIDFNANVLRVWPIADIAAADMVGPGGTARLTDAAWRPNSPADVAWVQQNSVGLFTYQTSSSGTIYRATGAANVAILAWRVDGSGILLRDSERYLVIELASGQPTDVPGFGTVVRVEPILLR